MMVGGSLPATLGIPFRGEGGYGLRLLTKKQEGLSGPPVAEREESRKGSASP